MDDAVVKELFESASRGPSGSTWSSITRLGLNERTVELVDLAVSELWRLGPFGTPMSASAACGHLASLPSVAPAEPALILQALLAAGLVRARASGVVEVPAYGREGLLLPLRRLLLYTAGNERPSRAEASSLHMGKVIGSDSEDDHIRRAAARRPFDSAVRVLTAKKGALRVVDGSYRLNGDHPFTQGTIRAAKLVVHSLQAPCDYPTACKRFDQLRLLKASRWLRVMKDVGLLGTNQYGQWGLGNRATRPPWSEL